VKAAADELQWVEFSERPHGQRSHNTGRFAAMPGAALARLEVLFRDEFLIDFDIPAGRAVIGRTPDNDLQIRSKFVSRHHAQIVSDETHSVIEDLNSTNGVFIRSRRIKQQQLVDGDVIQLGEHKLLYRDLRSGLAVAEDYDEDEELDDERDDEDDRDDSEDDDDRDDDLDEADEDDEEETKLDEETERGASDR
jgi:hypothetical protein